MRIKIDRNGRLHIEAEDNTESLALNRMIENNVKVYETFKLCPAGDARITLSDDKSLMPVTPSEGLYPVRQDPDLIDKICESSLIEITKKPVTLNNWKGDPKYPQ